MGHLGLGRFEAGLQVAEGIAEERIQVHRDEVAALGADPRVGQQAVDEPLHALRSVTRARNILRSLGIDLVREAELGAV